MNLASIIILATIDVAFVAVIIRIKKNGTCGCSDCQSCPHKCKGKK